MRRARFLLSVLAFVAFAAGPSYATSVTVLLSGEWDTVTDNASVTNGTIVVGSSFTVTLTYDDATADIDPDPTVGSYLLPAATSSLTLATGSYTFTLLASEGIIFAVDDNLSGQDDFGWFAENFTTSGPLPGGVTTGYGYMNPLVFDTTETAHSSDALTGLPWSVADYDSPNLGMYFLIAVNGAGAGKYIELFGDFTEFAVLPEPSVLTLAALGCAALLAVRRRG
jgi:hypothetical protein